ncbi:MAG: Glutamate--tRNA ligase [Phycisphaerae bacterium]|nr:Glutamate--tRNA ligase [Phycisphaerae bacterium]
MDSSGSAVVTRFAPSPTGYLHVGGARTALYSWLFARKQGGRFLLRIEDTDQKRNTEEAAAAIFEGLRWLDLGWDAEPVYQSQRLDIYNEYFRKLIDAGRAYECFVTPAELEAYRAQAREQKRDFIYKREWARITDAQRQKFIDEGRQPVLRLAMPEQAITVDDRVFGQVTTAAEQLEDFVIRKSDGFPTYHMAVVIDDALMGVTHVIRGQEHLGNTPKHIALQDALGLSRPTYAHLPILLNPDGSKISKRQDNPEMWSKGFPPVRVGDYQRRGYLPEALVNFLALLGWNPGDGRELMTRDELIAAFGPDRIVQSNARFNLEKLDWMNQQYIQGSPPDVLVRRLREFLAGTDYAAARADDAQLAALAPLYRQRARTLAEFAETSGFFFADAVELDPKAVEKVLLADDGAGLAELKRVRDLIASADPFEAVPMEEAFKAHCESLGLKLGKVAQPIRVAISGGTVSPPIFDTLVAIGREKSLARIDAAIEKATHWNDAPAAKDASLPQNAPGDVGP